jgi:8-oxo-dGTP pyrophosphatase MutT (NUDIX family)
VSPFTLRRKAARIVLLNARDEILLLHAADPANHKKPPWWEIPGGGMDAGETSAECAARELYEEAGIVAAEVGPCIWTMRNEFDFGGFHFDQDEFIHVAWCDDGEYAPTHLEALEAAAFDDGRWWGLDELLASDVPVLPIELRRYLPPIVAGELPDEPIDIGDLPPRDE